MIESMEIIWTKKVVWQRHSASNCMANKRKRKTVDLKESVRDAEKGHN